MDRLKMPEGEAIEAGIVTRSIEGAQRKVEARNFDMRKQLLEYDDVANDQRKVIYQQRAELLESTDISETIAAMREGVLSDVIAEYIPHGSMEEQWDAPGLEKALAAEFQLHLPVVQWLEQDKQLDENGLRTKVAEAAQQQYQSKVDQVGGEVMHGYERIVMLQSLDQHWREHLAALDHLRQGIHLRGYAQKNPKQEYKRELLICSPTLEAIKRDVTQPYEWQIAARRMWLPRKRPTRRKMCSIITPITKRHWHQPTSRLANTSRLCAGLKRSVATTPVHAVRVKNTNSATAD
jgi:preprotein translocase subunit SecA